MRQPDLSRSFARGILCACAGAPVVLASESFGELPALAVLGVSISLLLFVAALIKRIPRAFLLVAVVSAFACGVVVGADRFIAVPLSGLVYGVMCIAALESVLFGDQPHYGKLRDERAMTARGAAYGALGVGVLAFVLDRGSSSLPGLLTTTFFTTFLAGRWALAMSRRRRLTALTVAVAVGLVTAFILVSGGSSIAWVLLPVTVLLLVHVRRRVRSTSLWSLISEHPQRLLVATFALMCGLGTLILDLPVAAAEGVEIGAADALFTAVSAVCVTGLAVLDTATQFSFTGQLMILVLIQLGGLGIMTFSTLILRALGRRVSLRHEGAVAGILSHHDRGGLTAVARKLILLTAISEGLG
ncbi:MAG: potassium transporter TrkG, partial [Nannocystaceae bacterium]